MTDLLVRPMRPGDRPAVVELMWALNRVEDALAGDRVATRAEAEDCVAYNAGRIAETGGQDVVAERGGRILGYLCWSVEDAGPFIRADLRRVGYVRELVVAEAARGAGIGRALLAEAERLTRARGLKRLMLAVLAGNEGAIAAYRSGGFRVDALEMMKDL